MANRTITAFIAHLEITRQEAEKSQSAGQIIGLFAWDKTRLTNLLDQAKHILAVDVSDTPETHPEAAP